MASGPNPRGKKLPASGSPQPGGRFGSPLGIALVLALAFFLFRGFFQELGGQRVPYSRFRDAALQGEFSRVVIGDDYVKGTPARAPAPAAGPPTKAGARPTGPPPPPQTWTASRVRGDNSIIPLLEARGIEFEAAQEGGLLDLVLVWVVPIGLALLFWSFLARRASGGLGAGGPPGVMAFGKSKARVYMESNTGMTFKDVAGIDEAVDELREIVDFLKTPEKFRRLGARIPKGVLLVGPPGTGKTLLARAVAGEAGVPFFSLSGSEFVEMFVGVGAARVRDLFAQAAAKAPSIIFIDELDAIGKSRNSGIIGGHDEREQTLNQLLAEMDGFDARVGLILLAATNRPEILDPALLRPGRFDRQVVVDRPDKKGREEILRIHAREVKLGKDVDLRLVAARTPGFAGADLANAVNEAALLAGRKNREAVLMADFNEAIERVVAGLERKTRRMNEHEKETVAYHEGGHALVTSLVPRGEPVHKISIIPRGVAALGYTMSLPLEDRYLASKDELRDKLAGLMGGRAAEELVIGEVSTGAANDLEQATQIARLMVTSYGMSTELGPISLSESRGRSVFLGGAMMPTERAYSEHTQLRVDTEVARLCEEALSRARAVLLRHREALDRIAARLMAVEVIEGEELQRILVESGASREAYEAGPVAAAEA